jgi:lysophospholipase L1-like esterase
MQRVDFYGDSYTQGYGISEKSHRFSTVLCQMMGWRESNYGAGGTMAADPEQSGAIAHNASHIKDSSISIWLLGFNDANYYGKDSGLHDFLTCVESDAALLAIPASRRLSHDDSRITYHGNWTSVPALGGMHIARRGASATFTLSGKTILIGTALSVDNPGAIRVVVDNAERAVFQCRMEQPTAHRAILQPALVKITDLAPGVHAVECDADGDGEAALCWAAGLDGTSLSPRVYVGGVVACGPSGYAATNGSLEASDLFSTNLERSMNQLASFGLNIRYSRPTLDLSTQLAADRVHPNDDGYLSIARQIASVMSATP